MLTYHPAFDSYHCFLRVLTLLVNSQENDLEVDSARILDFYLCAPSGLKTFKFPRELFKERKIFSDKVNEYNDVPNQRSLFVDLRRVQDAVFDQMLSMEIIEYESFCSGRLELVAGSVPDELISIVESEKSIDADAKKFVLNKLMEIPLLGPNGLKHRSGLMDHRYDLV